MDKLCFKKYRSRIALDSIGFALSIVLCFLGFSVEDKFYGVVGVILVPVFAVILCRRLYHYKSYSKRCLGVKPNEAVIANWQIGGHRSRVASVSIKVSGKEYFSPTYFGVYEAEYMVGHKVSYVIIDETLLIYDILT